MVTKINKEKFVVANSNGISRWHINKAGYTATPVACGWAGAVFEVT